MWDYEPDYSFIPNPGSKQPHDLPPSPKMKVILSGKEEPGVWPEEYKHLDTGKPLVQEIIDLEIQKYVGDDLWLDFSREAARRAFRFQLKGARLHTAPEYNEREIDVSVFLDVGPEFNFTMKEIIRFWSLHSIAHVKRKAMRLEVVYKLQSSFEARLKINAARQRNERGKERQAKRNLLTVNIPSLRDQMEDSDEDPDDPGVPEQRVRKKRTRKSSMSPGTRAFNEWLEMSDEDSDNPEVLEDRGDPHEPMDLEVVLSEEQEESGKAEPSTSSGGSTNLKPKKRWSTDFLTNDPEVSKDRGDTPKPKDQEIDVLGEEDSDETRPSTSSKPPETYHGSIDFSEEPGVSIGAVEDSDDSLEFEQTFF